MACLLCIIMGMLGLGISLLGKLGAAFSCLLGIVEGTNKLRGTAERALELVRKALGTSSKL